MITFEYLAGNDMKPLPESDGALFVRTDFSDDDAWRAICAEIRESPDEDREAFAAWAEINAAIGQPLGQPQAALEIVDDPEYASLSAEQLLRLVGASSALNFFFVVDKEAVARPDHPILVVNSAGRQFRTLPPYVQTIENNLSIANMDWEDFADSTDQQSVFRGFAR